MSFTLKSQLQYERDFCNLMDSLGHHAERVAASGRRKNSVCDTVLLTSKSTYLVEVRATKEKKYKLANLHGLVEVAKKFNIPSLIAVRFKGNCHLPGRWVHKVITNELSEVGFYDESDPI